MSHDTGNERFTGDEGPDNLDKIMLKLFAASAVIIGAVTVWAVFFRG